MLLLAKDKNNKEQAKDNQLQKHFLHAELIAAMIKKRNLTIYTLKIWHFLNVILL